MDLLRILCFILLLPCIYPFLRIVRRDDLNIWDFLLFFHGFFFGAIPLLSKDSSFSSSFINSLNSQTTVEVFCVVLLFELLLVLISRWLKEKSFFDEDNIMNITLFIRNIPKLKFSPFFYIFLVINLVISAIWYIPNTGVVLQLEEMGAKSYSQTSSLMIYSFVFSLCLCFCGLETIREKDNITNNKILSVCTIGFLLLSMFLSRRTFLMYILFLCVIYYSFYKDVIDYRKLLLRGIPFLLIVNLYFTFYNISRFSTTKFDLERPVDSTIALIDESIKNWGDENKNASDLSESRSLNLFTAFYDIVNYDTDPSYGSLLLKSIDYAAPRFISPNKGEGIQEEMSRRCKADTDVADSILFDAYGDFNCLAFVYALLIYCFYFYFNKAILFFFRDSSLMYIIGFFFVFSFFSIAWNIEQDLSVVFSRTIQQIPFVLCLFIMIKLDMLGIDFSDT